MYKSDHAGAYETIVTQVYLWAYTAYVLITWNVIQSQI